MSLLGLPPELRQDIILRVLGQCLIQEDVGERILKRGSSSVLGRIEGAGATDKKCWRSVITLGLVSHEFSEDVGTVVWRWLQTGPSKFMRVIDVHNLLSNVFTEGDGEGRDLRKRLIALDCSEWREGTFEPHLETRVSRLMVGRRPSYLTEVKWNKLVEACAEVESTGEFVCLCWQYLGEVLGGVVDECFVVNDEDGRFVQMLEKDGLRVYSLDRRARNE